MVLKVPSQLLEFRHPNQRHTSWYQALQCRRTAAPLRWSSITLSRYENQGRKRTRDRWKRGESHEFPCWKTRPWFQLLKTPAQLDSSNNQRRDKPKVDLGKNASRIISENEWKVKYAYIHTQLIEPNVTDTSHSLFNTSFNMGYISHLCITLNPGRILHTHEEDGQLWHKSTIHT